MSQTPGLRKIALILFTFGVVVFATTFAAKAGTNGGAEDVYFSRIDTPGSVPETTSLLLLGTGLFGVAGAARRRLKNLAWLRLKSAAAITVGEEN